MGVGARVKKKEMMRDAALSNEAGARVKKRRREGREEQEDRRSQIERNVKKWEKGADARKTMQERRMFKKGKLERRMSKTKRRRRKSEGGGNVELS